LSIRSLMHPYSISSLVEIPCVPLRLSLITF
jgi:hypothetical protein